MDFCLRKWEYSDGPALAAAADDPQVACALRDFFPSPYTEEDALQLAGESLGSRYRTLSSLLVTHLTCGGEEALLLLEKEARDAFEAERLRAKVRGEEATTKLLFPMLLMLGVVLAVLIIPAFCALGI